MSASSSSSNASPLVVIVGETASGKSALALQIAQQFNGEIICADSLTVYRHFTIGTAKPTLAEQRLVPHHCLDIADPAAGFSAPLFQQAAMQAIAETTARGNLPILVGGTGLYIDCVIYDYSFLPAGPVGERAELDAMGLDELMHLAQDRAISTAQVDTRNKRRLVRLIESNGRLPVRSTLRAQTLLLGMSVPLDILTTRIAARVDVMLAAGLEAEVRQLVATYGWLVEPMKSIGYREFQPLLAGKQDMDKTKQQIIRASLQLAKKQRTWFKRNKSIHWIQQQREAVDLVTTLLSK